MIEALHFTRPKALLYPAAQVYEWETTLVVAPYADHQWLGCAGAIALLRRMGYRVRILFVGNSQDSSFDFSYSAVPDQLIEAMAYLKISEQAIINLQLQPQLFPRSGDPGFTEATRLMVRELEDLNPDSLVIPAMNDELPDLLATRQIAEEAQRQLALPLKVIEYPLLNDRTLTDSVTKPTHEYDLWRLDVREVIDDKVAALQKFRHREASPAPAPEDIPAWETYLQYRG